AEGVSHLVPIAEHGAVAGRPALQRVERGAEAVAAKHRFHAGEGGVGHGGGRWPAPGAEAEEDGSNHYYRGQRAEQDWLGADQGSPPASPPFPGRAAPVGPPAGSPGSGPPACPVAAASIWWLLACIELPRLSCRIMSAETIPSEA